MHGRLWQRDVAAEFALVSARRTRIEALVRKGDRKAKAAQRAQQDLYRQLSAAQLGITVGNVKIRAHRARKLLREKLEPAA